MGIYESIADLLNMDENDKNAETALLEKLNELNTIYRETKDRRKSIDRRISEIREEIGEHNRSAERAVRIEEESRARKELKKKKQKMRLVDRLVSEKSELREKEDNIMKQRERLKDKIRRLRKREL